VLSGRVAVGDTVELPALRVARPVKGIQIFRRPVGAAAAGDRAALCLTQLDPAALERGLAAAPGSVPTFNACVACVDKIRRARARWPKQTPRTLAAHARRPSPAPTPSLP